MTSHSIEGLSDGGLREGLVERLTAYADKVGRRAEIMRQFADQQADAGYRATAEADADGEELLAADLRAILALSAAPERVEGGGWEPIESAPPTGSFLAAIHHGAAGYRVVEARRIGPGVRHVLEDSCVSWSPGHLHPAYYKPLPSPPIGAEGGRPTSSDGSAA